MKTKNTAATAMEIYTLFTAKSDKTRPSPIKSSTSPLSVMSASRTSTKGCCRLNAAPRRYFDEAIRLNAARLLLPSALYSARKDLRLCLSGRGARERYYRHRSLAPLFPDPRRALRTDGGVAARFGQARGAMYPQRHARTCCGHPRLDGHSASKTWVGRPSPAMTMGQGSAISCLTRLSGRATSRAPCRLPPLRRTTGS
jgi:hypothetical protein